MARRRSHRVDMLPLLDVFMVVLFVFATIQESKLDATTSERDSAAAELTQAQAELEQQREQTEAQRDRADAAEAQRQALADEVEAYQRACGPARPGGPRCPAAVVGDARELAKQVNEMAALHERLLDNVAVFEIEIEGSPDLEANALRNRCCVRADPPTGDWLACGEIPGDPDAREAWLDDGGQGLLDALRRTRSGNAIVLLRQDGRARFRLSNDLAELLRKQLPEHRIYDDGLSREALRCPLLTDAGADK